MWPRLADLPVIVRCAKLCKAAANWPGTPNRFKLASSICHAAEVKVSHASMLKARRHHQKTRKILDGEIKRAKRLAKQAAAARGVKKENSGTEK